MNNEDEKKNNKDKKKVKHKEVGFTFADLLSEESKAILVKPKKPESAKEN